MEGGKMELETIAFLLNSYKLVAWTCVVEEESIWVGQNLDSTASTD